MAAWQRTGFAGGTVAGVGTGADVSAPVHPSGRPQRLRGVGRRYVGDPIRHRAGPATAGRAGAPGSADRRCRADVPGERGRGDPARRRAARRVRRLPRIGVTGPPIRHHGRSTGLRRPPATNIAIRRGISSAIRIATSTAVCSVIRTPCGTGRRAWATGPVTDWPSRRRRRRSGDAVRAMVPTSTTTSIDVPVRHEVRGARSDSWSDARSIRRPPYGDGGRDTEAWGNEPREAGRAQRRRPSPGPSRARTSRIGSVVPPWEDEPYDGPRPALRWQPPPPGPIARWRANRRQARQLARGDRPRRLKAGSPIPVLGLFVMIVAICAIGGAALGYSAAGGSSPSPAKSPSTPATAPTHARPSPTGHHK